MMEQFVRHLVNITGHKDQTLLDISVVLALHDLTGAAQVRVLDIMPFRGELYVQPRLWIENGAIVSVSELGLDHTGLPLSAYPVLGECLRDSRKLASEITGDGRRVLWIPIWLNEKVTSCIELSKLTEFDAGAMTLIQAIADVYHNSLSMLDYSQRDSLTGLFNRKTFDEKFAKMAFSLAPAESQATDLDAERRAEAKVKEQWLAVVDIDHFKQVNDRFGHLYGDEVLILVANLLRDSFRAQDRVFRFGGEEFVILLRSTTCDNAMEIFERLRRKVEAHKFPQVGNVTVSIGFVRISLDTPVVMLGHADQALYYAKEHGRNRVCCYEALVAEGLLQSEVSNENVEFF